MLPVVKKEVFDVVKTQFQGETLAYVERMLDKIKTDQPILYQFFIDQNREFIGNLMEIEDNETRESYAIINMISVPIMVYEMLRNQDEANEMNELLS